MRMNIDDPLPPYATYHIIGTPSIFIPRSLTIEMNKQIGMKWFHLLLLSIVTFSIIIQSVSRI